MGTMGEAICFELSGVHDARGYPEEWQCANGGARMAVRGCESGMSHQ